MELWMIARRCPAFVSPEESGMASEADKSLSERFEKDLAAVKKDITQLSERIADTLNAVSGEATKQARRGYRQARRNVDAALSDAQERGRAAMEAAQDAAASIEETLEDAIRERPVAAIAMAVGLGFLIGVTWRR
jgi:ElaB/YqjD/DUF883 family membrane-anchored ribosome-binding protein